MRVFVIIVLALVLTACGKEEGPDYSVHCFNEAPKGSLTLPSYTNTTCPTINQ